MKINVLHPSSSYFNTRRKSIKLLCSGIGLLVAAAVLFRQFAGTEQQQQTALLQHNISVTAGREVTQPWEPSASQLWAVVAAWQPRSENRCPYSSCPPENRRPHATTFDANATTSAACPAYFSGIKDHLSPWKTTRISAALLAEARKYEASFTVIIKSGRLYVEGLGNCYQTRALFSIWGFLQLLRFYPGLLPDVELVFGCGDIPAVNATSATAPPPPPVFRYCTTPRHLDIPFPDWSFWGWPEVNIKPWEIEREEIQQASTSIPWLKRIAKAFWKGNIYMGEGARMELLKCNGDTAEIQNQDWKKEVKAGFQHSKLSQQCKHRYKVYVEGIGWSVSLKYILACDSELLMVEPKYIEFFRRGLIEGRHYRSIPRYEMCPSIASIVEWGNNHVEETMAVGKAGSDFVRSNLSIKHVYDYMLHMLQEYASLLDFEPQPHAGLKELCLDAFLCVAPPSERGFYESSLVDKPSASPPCSMGPLNE